MPSLAHGVERYLRDSRQRWRAAGDGLRLREWRLKIPDFLPPPGGGPGWGHRVEPPLPQACPPPHPSPQRVEGAKKKIPEFLPPPLGEGRGGGTA